jgi:SAM-dependent methyltransferase
VTTLSSAVRRLVHFGLRRYCPACGASTRRFGSYGIKARPDARCLVCNSSERERAQCLLIERCLAPRLAQHGVVRILHLAPEPGIERRLRAIAGAEYISGDIEQGRAMQVVDLTNLAFGDASLDLLFVSHVLEHIEDDARAIAEMRRVLKPGGLVLVEVPVLRQKTLEDFSIRTAVGRERAFGQSDHVRVCGLDYAERLRAGGFGVEPLSVAKQFTPEEIQRSRLLVELPAELIAALPSWYEKNFDVTWLCSVPGSN